MVTHVEKDGNGKPHVEKGDAVVLSEFLEVKEEKDPYNVGHWVAVPPWTREKKKPPYNVFDVFVGVYTGMKYISQRQPRRGIVQVPMHGFFFSDREVFIDPKFIKVVARFNESIG